jgi:nicotinate-nucleotide--dimethylbenzimidazole phosphoribosyltransferase
MFELPRSIEHGALFSRSRELTMPHGALDSVLLPVLQIHAQRKSPHAGPMKAAGLLFAGDHAVARRHQVSAYPVEVTPQMVANIVRGGAAISNLSARRNAPLWVCDVGVATGFDTLFNFAAGLQTRFVSRNIHKKFPEGGFEQGSRDITSVAALSPEAHLYCWNSGAALAEEMIATTGCDLLFLGEMGIGNTTPASALAALALKKTPAQCVGRGTGVDDLGLQRKQKVVTEAVERFTADFGTPDFNSLADAHRAMREVGGAELSALAGAAWRAAQLGCFVLLDGLIVTAAVAPYVLAERKFSSWLLASHQSAEPVHAELLRALELSPLLSLGLRLGEGSGAALALGLLQDADALLRGMATFSAAGVSSGELGK